MALLLEWELEQTGAALIEKSSYQFSVRRSLCGLVVDVYYTAPGIHLSIDQWNVASGRSLKIDCELLEKRIGEALA